MEMHDDEHPQDDFHGGGAAAVDAGQRVAPHEVLADAGEDHVVVEEAVESGQLGLELEPELGGEGEEVDGLVAVAEHGRCLRDATARGNHRASGSLPTAARAVHFAPQTSAKGSVGAGGVVCQVQG